MERGFRVRNPGPAAAEVRADSPQDWIEVRPAALRLGPGEEGVFSVRVSPDRRPRGAPGRVRVIGPAGFHQEIELSPEPEEAGSRVASVLPGASPLSIELSEGLRASVRAAPKGGTELLGGQECPSCREPSRLESAGLGRCPSCLRLVYVHPSRCGSDPSRFGPASPGGERPQAAPGPGDWRPGQRIEGLPDDIGFVTGIKAGGMGVVLICYGSRWGRPYVLKTYADDVDYAPDLFRREAENWISLGRHPNVVRAYAVLERDRRLYVATELVPRHPRRGTDLGEWIASGALELELALDFAAQICRGMEHAAARFPAGFVHRDLKPANILIHPNGEAKVSDFGLAIPLPRGGGLRSGGGGGTPTTMSPEQWTEGASLDARSDVYSFGCVLFEMLTGRRVFLGNRLRLGYLHLNAEPPPLRELAPGVPEGVARLVARCLRKAPAERFPDFRRLREALEAARASKGGAAPASAPPAVESGSELVNRAHGLLVLRKPREALELLERARRLGYDGPTLYINRGAARGLCGDLQGEIADLTEALARDPSSFVAYRNRGYCRMKCGEMTGARMDFEAAQALLPAGDDPHLGPRDAAETTHTVGCVRHLSGDFPGAIAAFSEALRLNPEHPEAQAMRSQARLELGDPQGALRDLDEAVARHPGVAAGWAFRAHVKNALRDFAGAEADAAKAIALDPAFPQAHNNRAAARFNRKDFAGCVEDCDAAIRVMPSLGMAYLNRANAFLELRRFADAARDYRTALETGLPEPWDAVARAGLEFLARGGRS